MVDLSPLYGVIIVSRHKLFSTSDLIRLEAVKNATIEVPQPLVKHRGKEDKDGVVVACVAFHW
jgi:hypothetical protein